MQPSGTLNMQRARRTGIRIEPRFNRVELVANPDWLPDASAPALYEVVVLYDDGGSALLRTAGDRVMLDLDESRLISGITIRALANGGGQDP